MAIKAIAMDVDGVLTDGSVWLDRTGHESKRLSFKDIMGISRGRQVGLLFALVSGEGGELLAAIATKLGVTDVYPDCKDKAAAVRDFAGRHEVDLSEVCYIGDDVNDLSALQICGLAVAPADAHPSALAIADIVTIRLGGAGAVREVVDALIEETSSHPVRQAALPSR